MRAAQDASLRLYMCVLLRARPMLASAVVMGLNGDRFLDVYVAELGIELRLFTADLVPGPVEASWNCVTRCCGPETERIYALTLGFYTTASGLRWLPRAKTRVLMRKSAGQGTWSWVWTVRPVDSKLEQDRVAVGPRLAAKFGT